MLIFGLSAIARAQPPINGIAIVQYAPHDLTSKACKISLGWNSGKILRFDVTNGTVSEPRTIYDSYDAHCPRINPSGTHVAFNTSTYSGNCRQPSPNAGCKSTLYVIPVDGGEPRKLVDGINCLSVLDWPMDEYIYYSKDYYSRELYRVNTSGTPKPEKIGGMPAGRYWSVSSDGKRIAGFFDGSLKAGTVGSGGISWRNVWGGCGGSISPNGVVMTRNGGSHNEIFFHAFEGGLLYNNFEHKPNREKNTPELKASMCPDAGAHWHRMHWPVNSSEWLIISQGNGYQIDEGSVPVLLKHDGSECLQIVDLVSDPDHKDGLHYEGSDFWFDYSVDARKPARIETLAPSLELQADAHSIRIATADSRAFHARLFSPDGRLVSSLSSDKGDAGVLSHPARSGVYLLRVETPDQAISRRVVVP
jgi:hypothetical protein